MNLSDFIPLHHAYLIEGDARSSHVKLLKILKKEHGINIENNPDFLTSTFGTFAIEDARNIKEQASRRAVGTGKRIFIISLNSMTREAGNALLKTLEEPTEGTYFFILIPSIKRILPTILSRCRVIYFSGEKAASLAFGAGDFILLPIPKRLAVVKDILSDLEKEKISKSDVFSFIQEVVKTKHSQIKNIEEFKSLGFSSKVASYALDQSSSVKLILEYLALCA